VARQAGHSATMALDTYGHVFDELDGAEKMDAEAAIWAARGTRCYLGATWVLPQSVAALLVFAVRATSSRSSRGFPAEPSDGLEPATPSL
jgi:hypothetical protein